MSDDDSWSTSSAKKLHNNVDNLSNDDVNVFINQLLDQRSMLDKQSKVPTISSGNKELTNIREKN